MGRNPRAWKAHHSMVSVDSRDVSLPPGGRLAERIVLSCDRDLELVWPYIPARLEQRLGDNLRRVETESGQALGEVADLASVGAIALFGGGRLTEDCLKGAPNLKVVGGVFDNHGGNLPLDALTEAGVAIVDATRGWAPSVAEVTLTLALCALRRIPWWHGRLAAGEQLWDFEAQQFCDNPGFVNGTLGSKRVGVIGLGQIGSRVAEWCSVLGSSVAAYDPFSPEERFRDLGVEKVDMDTLVEDSEVVFVTVPPTPSARHLLSRERVQRLQKGALVVISTRAHAVDMDALRERVVADELTVALDVYDKEPLPTDDVLRGRENVVHLPHIAGRTRDANERVADLIAEDFERVLRGEAPQNGLTPEAIAVRRERTDLPG
jgi:D-3-phosphoglycerate dehydrogenase